MDSSGISEPSILLACKQILTVAAGIFYLENWFNIVTSDWEVLPLQRWDDKIQGIRAKYKAMKDTIVYFTFLGNPNWRNLEEWLKRFHAGSIMLSVHPPSRRGPFMDIEHATIGAMFSLVQKLQDKPWDFVESLLHEQYLLLVALYPQWGMDGDV